MWNGLRKNSWRKSEESHNLEYPSVQDYDVAPYKSMLHLFTAPRIKCVSETADLYCRQPIFSTGCFALRSACSPRNDNEVCSLAPCDSAEQNNPVNCFARGGLGRGGKKKLAFTLAEVLITLGIIGIVAAMTIPTLITKFRVIELETRFKKADAIFQQALKSSLNELGYDDASEFNIPYESITDRNINDLKDRVTELNKVWTTQLQVSQKISNNVLYSQGVSHIYGMLGSQWPNNYYFDAGSREVYFLNNGMLVTSFRVENNGGMPAYITFKFDTNGPYSGPNRLGHDIFAYQSYFGRYNSMCNPTIQNSGNQVSCYYWAHKNMNPKDNSTPYWNILYKPLSYWQK